MGDDNGALPFLPGFACRVPFRLPRTSDYHARSVVDPRFQRLIRLMPTHGVQHPVKTGVACHLSVHTIGGQGWQGGFGLPTRGASPSTLDAGSLRPIETATAPGRTWPANRPTGTRSWVNSATNVGHTSYLVKRVHASVQHHLQPHKRPHRGPTSNGIASRDRLASTIPGGGE